MKKVTEQSERKINKWFFSVFLMIKFYNFLCYYHKFLSSKINSLLILYHYFVEDLDMKICYVMIVCVRNICMCSLYIKLHIKWLWFLILNLNFFKLEFHIQVSRFSIFFCLWKFMLHNGLLLFLTVSEKKKLKFDFRQVL